jgi:hypothetical protein
MKKKKNVKENTVNVTTINFMKKTSFIFNILFLIIIIFLVFRNIYVTNQSKVLESDLIIIDSLIKDEYLYITTNYNAFYDEDAKQVVLLGSQLIYDFPKRSSQHQDFVDLCKKYNYEKYLYYNPNYSITEIKLLQFITLKNISERLTPFYKFDGYRIIAVDEVLKQSKSPQKVRLWLEFLRKKEYYEGEDYIKIVHNNDTISKKGFYYEIEYIPNQKGRQHIPVNILHDNKMIEEKDYIYVNVK